MSWREDNAAAKRRWRGPLEKYDLISEGLIAFVVVAVLLVGLAILFGTPKVNSISFQTWAQAAPVDFVATTLTELTGTSETATYGPPYNQGTVDLKIDPNLAQTVSGNTINPSGPTQLQSLGPFSPQGIAGVMIPVNPPADFVLKPLAAFAQLNPPVNDALVKWNNASLDEKSAWANAALSSTITVAGSTVTMTADPAMADKDMGPIPVMMDAMLKMAQSGALTSQSIDAAANAYSTNNTKSLLYIEDGNYLGDPATKYALTGPQWGVTNEIGSWPGQPWLWWYVMWYNIPGWSNIGTDILAVASAVPVLLIVLFLPFIPGLRNIPRWVPIYKLIWRNYYRDYGSKRKAAPVRRPAS